MMFQRCSVGFLLFLSMGIANILLATPWGVNELSRQQEKSDEPVEKEPPTLPTVEAWSMDREANEGFQTWHWDPREGRVWLEISKWDEDFLFACGLATGLGSNPIGLDRGQLGKQWVCQFRRVGNKVFLVAKNLDYRATTPNMVEKRAVQESFAESIIWGGVVAAETGDTVIVDFTDLLTSDLHGVVKKIRAAEQGEFQIDQARCGVFKDRCRAFPKNTELEATLTFTGTDPGRLVQQVAPSADSITLRQHVSFIELPAADYQPRVHHPRCASMHITFADYATPINEPLEKRWILRHRLQKKDRTAARSTAVEPIVYYVDPGAPELIREALIEGARWWNEAFEAAGFIDAFEVRVLPADADPMDVRYNVIQWVHRSTRGWSYGGSIIDPRTGEIIKGHVSLGSLRVRQDRLLFDAMGLKGLTKSGTPGDQKQCGLVGVSEEAALAALSRDVDPVEVALARIRQLSAHEVGHTLGFVHNFAASTYDDRASVMDYPAPRIRIDAAEKLDLSDAYGVGIGTWDKWSVRYAYEQFEANENEAEKLTGLVQEAIQNNMVFVSDDDSRPAAAAHPAGNLWDNGSDPIAQLQHVMRVREIALNALQPSMLRKSDPLSDFEQIFVPLYLHHRYQVEATAKMIGGVYYSYGDAATGQPMSIVSPEKQRMAFQTLLRTLAVEGLVIDDKTWNYLVPASIKSHRDVERFPGTTSPVFDRLASARVAADMTIGGLLNPGRVSRLAMTSKQEGAMTPAYLVSGLVNFVWQQPTPTQQSRHVATVLKQSVTDHLLALLVDSSASDSARAAARAGIEQIKRNLTAQSAGGGRNAFFEMNLADQIRRFESRPYPNVDLPKPLPAPPGSPIGQ